MRVFVALACDQLQGKCLDKVCEVGLEFPLHQPLDRHMTLCFLGERSKEEVHTLANKIDSIYKQTLCKPIHWRSKRIADFPSSKAKVWALQGEGNPELTTLQAQIAQACEVESTYDFMPHVSLAYIKRPSNLVTPLEAQWVFDQLVICRSFTQDERKHFTAKDGWAKPRYEVLKRWDLKA